MSLERSRAQSLLGDTILESADSVRITNRISLKNPRVGETISKWKPAKKGKSFRQRCTRSETGGFCMTNFVIIALATLFCWCIPWNLSKDEHTQWMNTSPGSWIVFVLGLTSSLMSLLCLWLTYITDPGVIERQSELELRRLDFGERHCNECKIIRPRRGKHCKHCDHCVEVFDHHCPYAGVCIGNGNYLFFCLLLLSGIISSTYVSVFSGWFLKENWPVGGNTWARLKYPLIVALALAVISTSIFLLITYLSLYHVFIVVKGQTTNEWIKNSRSRKKLIQTVDTPSKEPLLGSRKSQDTSSYNDTTYSFTETKGSTTCNTETTAGDARFADL